MATRRPGYEMIMIMMLISCVSAQPGPPLDEDPSNGLATANFNSSTAIIIVILVSAFFFLAFFSIYIRQCNLNRSAAANPARVFAEGANRRSRRPGLDPALLETFPTMVYSEVKELRTVKGALECAVCLSEFSDDETLRLLPRCSHAFHPDCIDVWLASHVTCPVCRSNLAEAPDGSAEEPPAEHVAIDVQDEEDAGEEERPEVPAEECERYTLRLPEHVIKEIVAARKFRRATSCIGFPAGGEESERSGYRERGAAGGRSLRAATRSDSWGPSFLRALSTKMPAWAAGRRGEAGSSGGGGGRQDATGGGENESSATPFRRV